MNDVGQIYNFLRSEVPTKEICGLPVPIVIYGDSRTHRNTSTRIYGAKIHTTV
jgi:hypothetical protein